MDKVVIMNNKQISENLDVIQNIIQIYTKTEGGVPILTPPDPLFSYILGRNCRILKNEFYDFNESRKEAVRKYGKYEENEDGSGSYVIDMKDKDQVKAYEDYIDKLNKVEHEVKLTMITLDQLREWNLPIQVETLLWFLIDDPRIND